MLCAKTSMRFVASRKDITRNLPRCILVEAHRVNDVTLWPKSCPAGACVIGDGTAQNSSGLEQYSDAVHVEIYEKRTAVGGHSPEQRTII